MSEARPCPECQQGKHENCTMMVLLDTDEEWGEDWDVCACRAAGHQP